MAEFTNPHNISYPVAADRIKDPNVVAKLAADIKAVAVSANDAITSEGARAEESAYERAKWKKGIIPDGVDVREYVYGKDGQFTSLSGTSTATMTGLPDDLLANPFGFTLVAETLGNGTALTLTTYTVWGNAKYACTSAPADSFNQGWTRWNKYKWDEGATDAPGNSSGSGTKVLPLILTAGRGGGESLAPTSAAVKYDVSLSSSVEVVRYRFAIRDGNPRWGTKTAQAISMTGIKFGGVQKLSSFTTNANGDVSFSPWFTGNFGSMEFSYTCPQAPRLIVGGGTVNGVRQTEMPFELWLECEIPASVGSVGLIGDSNSVAVNATIPVHDSWMQIYCRRMGFFPVLYGHSGDGMSQSGDAGHYKWNRWNHLDKPDLVVHANGANDLPPTEGGVTLADMQGWAEAEWMVGAQKISANQHTALLKSRASGANNTVRLAYNSWLKTYPEPTREWHDIASPVTANDTGGLLPQYISSDGIHMTTAGHQAIADAISKFTTTSVSSLKYDTDGVPYF